jgi:EpsD family peptidyl-prolyl cis-trans isomerase
MEQTLITAPARCVALLALLALASCGKSGTSDHGSQVAARVNRDEVTVLQVNDQLARLPGGLNADRIDEGKGRALRTLVNRQLLVQEAVDLKLDRDPAVVGAIESARADILAQAVVSRVITPQAKPTDEEVRKYYNDNPDLFARRRLYRLQEISVSAAPDDVKEILAVAGRLHSLQEIGTYLRDRKISFGVDSGVRSAEQLPLAIVPKIANLRVGQVLAYVPAEGRLNVIEILASDLQPVDDKKAAPVIELYLTNSKRDKLVNEEVSRLEKAAKIEYVGEFVRIASGAAAAPPPAARPAADGNAAREADKDKGVAGLR